MRLALVVALAPLALGTPAQGTPALAQAAMPGMAMPSGGASGSAEAAPDGASGQAAGGDHGMSGMSGTDTPSPATPAAADAPPPITDHAADRIYDPSAMAAARAQLRREHGGETWSLVMLNLAEYQARSGGGAGYRWEGEASFGGDLNRLFLKTEGEGSRRHGVEAAEVQALYARTISPYFNLQAGVRQDLGPGPRRTYGTVGFEGLAPYLFEVSGAVFLSDRGEALARLEGYEDFRVTQRLILQPRIEANLAAQNSPRLGIGAGLSNLELGLRLRYEISREFAPYVGVSYDRRFGATAGYARARGERAGTPSLVVGVRTWF